MFRIRHVLDSENHYQTSENHGRIAVSEDSYGTDGRWRPLPMTRTRASRSRARRLGVVLAVAVLALAGLLSFLPVEPPAVTSHPRASAESSFLFGAVGDFDGVNDPDMLGLAKRLNAAGGGGLRGRARGWGPVPPAHAPHPRLRPPLPASPALRGGGGCGGATPPPPPPAPAPPGGRRGPAR